MKVDLDLIRDWIEAPCAILDKLFPPAHPVLGVGCMYGIALVVYSWVTLGDTLDIGRGWVAPSTVRLAWLATASHTLLIVVMLYAVSRATRASSRQLTSQPCLTLASTSKALARVLACIAAAWAINVWLEDANAVAQGIGRADELPRALLDSTITSFSAMFTTAALCPATLGIAAIVAAPAYAWLFIAGSAILAQCIAIAVGWWRQMTFEASQVVEWRAASAGMIATILTRLL